MDESSNRGIVDLMFVVDLRFYGNKQSVTQNQLEKKLHPTSRYLWKKIKTNRRDTVDKQLGVQAGYLKDFNIYVPWHIICSSWLKMSYV